MYVCRVRQIIENIRLRRKSQVRADAMLVEWSTKTLASVIAATVPTEKGKKNKLLEEVAKIRLLVDEADNDGQSAAFDLHNASEEELTRIVEGGANVQNNVGSFERLVGGLSRTMDMREALDNG